MANDRQNSSPDTPLGRRLGWLILGRALAAVLLLIVTFIWKQSTFGGTNLSSGVTPIILAVAGLTALYSVARLFLKHLLAQARVQFFFDILLVTWLVWIGGNISSPYAALYIVVIAVASLFLGPRGAMVTSMGSAAAFTACALAAWTGIGAAAMRPPQTAASLIDTIQAVGLADVSFLVVGLLAAKLAERQAQSDVQLEAATRSLASLRALHE